MAKVNISLVGGQTYPVYLGIAESKPDKVILIHSEKSKGEVERYIHDRDELIIFTFEKINV